MEVSRRARQKFALANKIESSRSYVFGYIKRLTDSMTKDQYRKILSKKIDQDLVDKYAEHIRRIEKALVKINNLIGQLGMAFVTNDSLATYYSAVENSDANVYAKHAKSKSKYFNHFTNKYVDMRVKTESTIYRLLFKYYFIQYYLDLVARGLKFKPSKSVVMTQQQHQRELEALLMDIQFQEAEFSHLVGADSTYHSAIFGREDSIYATYHNKFVKKSQALNAMLTDANSDRDKVPNYEHKNIKVLILKKFNDRMRTMYLRGLEQSNELHARDPSDSEWRDVYGAITNITKTGLVSSTDSVSSSVNKVTGTKIITKKMSESGRQYQTSTQLFGSDLSNQTSPPRFANWSQYLINDGSWTSLFHGQTHKTDLMTLISSDRNIMKKYGKLIEELAKLQKLDLDELFGTNKGSDMGIAATIITQTSGKDSNGRMHWPFLLPNSNWHLQYKRSKHSYIWELGSQNHKPFFMNKRSSRLPLAAQLVDLSILFNVSIIVINKYCSYKDSETAESDSDQTYYQFETRSKTESALRRLEIENIKRQINIIKKRRGFHDDITFRKLNNRLTEIYNSNHEQSTEAGLTEYASPNMTEFGPTVKSVKFGPRLLMHQDLGVLVVSPSYNYAELVSAETTTDAKHSKSDSKKRFSKTKPIESMVRNAIIENYRTTKQYSSSSRELDPNDTGRKYMVLFYTDDNNLEAMRSAWNQSSLTGDSLDFGSLLFNNFNDIPLAESLRQMIGDFHVEFQVPAASQPLVFDHSDSKIGALILHNARVRELIETSPYIVRKKYAADRLDAVMYNSGINDEPLTLELGPDYRPSNIEVVHVPMDDSDDFDISFPITFTMLFDAIFHGYNLKAWLDNLAMRALFMSGQYTNAQRGLTLDNPGLPKIIPTQAGGRPNNNNEEPSEHVQKTNAKMMEPYVGGTMDRNLIISMVTHAASETQASIGAKIIDLLAPLFEDTTNNRSGSEVLQNILLGIEPHEVYDPFINQQISTHDALREMFETPDEVSNISLQYIIENSAKPDEAFKELSYTLMFLGVMSFRINFSQVAGAKSVKSSAKTITSTTEFDTNTGLQTPDIFTNVFYTLGLIISDALSARLGDYLVNIKGLTDPESQQNDPLILMINGSGYFDQNIGYLDFIHNHFFDEFINLLNQNVKSSLEQFNVCTFELVKEIFKHFKMPKEIRTTFIKKKKIYSGRRLNHALNNSFETESQKKLLLSILVQAIVIPLNIYEIPKFYMFRKQSEIFDEHNLRVVNSLIIGLIQKTANTNRIIVSEAVDQISRFVIKKESDFDAERNRIPELFVAIFDNKALENGFEGPIDESITGRGMDEIEYGQSPAAMRITKQLNDAIDERKVALQNQNARNYSKAEKKIKKLKKKSKAYSRQKRRRRRNKANLNLVET